MTMIAPSKHMGAPIRMNGPNMQNNAPKPNMPRPMNTARVRPKNSTNASANLNGSVIKSNRTDAISLSLSLDFAVNQYYDTKSIIIHSKRKKVVFDWP